MQAPLGPNKCPLRSVSNPVFLQLAHDISIQDSFALYFRFASVSAPLSLGYPLLLFLFTSYSCRDRAWKQKNYEDAIPF